MTEGEILALAGKLIQHARHFDADEPTRLENGIWLLPFGNASILVNGTEVTANHDEYYIAVANRIKSALEGTT